MDNMTVLRHLHEFIRANEASGASKNNSRLFNELKTISPEDIYFGDAPQYFVAYINCNSTGVGESTYGNTKSQRTVARDYVTDEYLFIDGHLGAGKKGLELFYLKQGEIINFYSKDDIVKTAKEYGFNLHLQYFRDLNYSLTDHRLNRYNVNVTKGPFTYPVRPIFATTSKSKQVLIGYTYQANGTEYIIIEPERSKKVSELKEKTGCAPWMFFGFVFPPILLAAAFVLIGKYYKRRWRG